MSVQHRVRSCLSVLALAVASVSTGAACAQAFPTKPVTLVVPYAPGGAGDILGRTLAKELTTVFGKTVIVENRPGAGGNIGADAVVRAQDTDGHTLLLTATSLASNRSLMKRMPFDPLKDLVPVSGVAQLQNVVAVRPSLPIKSVADLIAYAKKNPGKLTFGTAGYGTSSHLSVELFKAEVDVDILHVPYKSGAPAMADMMADNLDLVFELMPAIVNHIRSEKLRGLAVTGQTRSPALPQLPTVAESGVPNYSFVSWFGVFAPAAMPKERVELLNGLINKAITSAEFKSRLDTLGAEAMPGSSQQFNTFFRGEVDKWAKVVANRNLPPLD